MRAPANIIPPPSLALRPTDRRGYPIPYVTFIDADGVPDFHALDYPHVVEVVNKHKCGLCGQDLTYWCAFVGGPLAVKNKTYTDPAMHIDCAEYAIRVCPFLAMPATAYARRTKHEMYTPPGMVMTKPPATVMLITRGYKVYKHSPQPWAYSIVPSPHKEIRVYPYEGDGYHYNPSPEVFAGLIAESQRRIDEEADADA